MMPCARCERLECAGHWVDSREAIELTRPYLAPETTGVIWSTLFRQEERHGDA